jgi:hypothetical protein
LSCQVPSLLVLVDNYQDEGEVFRWTLPTKLDEKREEVDLMTWQLSTPMIKVVPAL